MKPVLYAYTGEIGVGKTYCSIQQTQKLKSDGLSTITIAWADALKGVIERSLLLRKSGPITDGEPGMADKIQERLKKEILSLVAAQEDCFTDEHILPWETKFNAAWTAWGGEIIELRRGISVDGYSSTFRRLIQLIGTEIGRATRDEIWIDACLDNVEIAFETGVARAAIIDDTRFLNEYMAVKNFKRKFGDKYDIEFFGVEASLETRAARLGISEYEVLEFSTHDSERFVPAIIADLPPTNRIWNDSIEKT